jgi:murein DD-endopeptidase MepM/ murein hydrolase activator NlpD
VLGFVQAGQPDPLTLDGIFTLPLQGASLSSPYGLRIDPIGGAIGFHAGLDFGAEARTWIRAAGPGMVVVAGDCGGYGNCVVIDHGTSLATLYAHQSQVLVKVGDLVEVGQVIGLVGSTGISTGPHLHFEVRIHGRPIDPVPTLTT